jgi:hypothetical protein
VDQQASPTSNRLDHCLAGVNALHPDLMSAEQRLTELSQILAAGFLRLRRSRFPKHSSSSERNGLDFPPERSVHATARQRRKVGR